MGKQRSKAEESYPKAIRLPRRIWDLLAEASAKEYRNTNSQIQKLVEDFLVSKGYMSEEGRKKPVRRKHE